MFKTSFDNKITVKSGWYCEIHQNYFVVNKLVLNAPIKAFGIQSNHLSIEKNINLTLLK